MSVKPALLLTLLIALILACGNSAFAARLALVVGNDRYQHVSPLRNAGADAQTMAAAFRQAGYKVSLARDRDLKSFKDDLRAFKQSIRSGDEVVLYFSGHGLQLGGDNYLLPVDVRADTEDQVRDDAVPLSHVLADLRAARPEFTLAIIDACRDNPFPKTGRSIGGRGLTRVDSATGQMVLYAAGEGQQALDRLGNSDTVPNGLFTRVFVKEMTRPGVPVDQVLKNVRIEVNRLAKTVRHEQVPALYDQVLGTYYFYPPGNEPPPPVPPVQVASVVPEPVPAMRPAQPAQAFVPSVAQQPSVRQVVKDCDVCPELVVIPAGSFQMGGAESEAEANEKPVHSVNVKSFAIGKYEVTQGQFAAFVADSRYDAGNSCYVPADGKWGSKTGHNWQNPNFSQTDRDPVACVNWNDAQAFAQWLTQKTGQSYRLPTEAEWEYACRGGKQQQYCGSEDINAVAWYYQNSEAKTQAVGQKAANGFGLYDMSGNVWEWVQDGWYGSYQGAPNDGSERTAGANTSKRVLRGGAWSLSAKFARAAIRINPSSDLRYSNSGFRLARTIP
ncbi:MAG: SUMF1/EgtB/PvdO family nonheme iron enzyme [Hylemonella sp.]|jgi:formylglycine-generating enzyme required for sulfatase activity|nr:SUMF1/EgtB/PvdO family nonheme iron enzyme [Hylemonella sp.]